MSGGYPHITSYLVLLCSLLIILLSVSLFQSSRSILIRSPKRALSNTDALSQQSKKLKQELHEEEQEEEQQEQCPICLNPIEDNCITLPCTHSFFPDCLSQWLLVSPQCPHCRAQVSLETISQSITTHNIVLFNFLLDQHTIATQLTTVGPPKDNPIHTACLSQQSIGMLSSLLDS